VPSEPSGGKSIPQSRKSECRVKRRGRGGKNSFTKTLAGEAPRGRQPDVRYTMKKVTKFRRKEKERMTWGGGNRRPKLVDNVGEKNYPPDHTPNVLRTGCHLELSLLLLRWGYRNRSRSGRSPAGSIIGSRSRHNEDRDRAKTSRWTRGNGRCERTRRKKTPRFQGGINLKKRK